MTVPLTALCFAPESYSILVQNSFCLQRSRLFDSSTVWLLPEPAELLRRLLFRRGERQLLKLGQPTLSVWRHEMMFRTRSLCMSLSKCKVSQHAISQSCKTQLHPNTHHLTSQTHPQHLKGWFTWKWKCSHHSGPRCSKGFIWKLRVLISGSGDFVQVFQCNFCSRLCSILSVLCTENNTNIIFHFSFF